MRPTRKLLLAGIIVLIAAVAALPFQEQVSEPTSQEPGQLSRRRWRETRIPSPVPLRMQLGQSPAADLPPGPNGERDEMRVRPAGGLGRIWVPPPTPPRIPAVYQPLLETSRDDARLTLEGVGGGEATSSGASLAASNTGSTTAEEPPSTRFQIVRHTIRDGDTLQGISARYLGDSRRYLEIYEVNKQRLPSAEVLPLNVEIEVRIPR